MRTPQIDVTAGTKYKSEIDNIEIETRSRINSNAQIIIIS